MQSHCLLLQLHIFTFQLHNSSSTAHKNVEGASIQGFKVATFLYVTNVHRTCVTDTKQNLQGQCVQCVSIVCGI